jgi:hypothetical protein
VNTIAHSKGKAFSASIPVTALWRGDLIPPPSKEKWGGDNRLSNRAEIFGLCSSNRISLKISRWKRQILIHCRPQNRINPGVS